MRRAGRIYGRKAARRIMRTARTETCEIPSCAKYLWELDEAEGVPILFLGQVDHIVPERFARRVAPGSNPHHLANLICICSADHGKKVRAENMLERADVLGYKAELNRLGWNMRRIERAFAEVLG